MTAGGGMLALDAYAERADKDCVEASSNELIGAHQADCQGLG